MNLAFVTELFHQEAYTLRQICGTKDELPFLTNEEYEAPFDPGMIEQRRMPAGFPDIDSPVYEDLEAASCPECLTEVPADITDRFCQSQRGEYERDVAHYV